MFAKLSNTWAIMRASLSIVRQDKELVLFSLLSSVCCLLVLASFAIPMVQADASRIAEIYRRSGRYDVSVVPEIIEQPNNRVDLIFTVNEVVACVATATLDVEVHRVAVPATDLCATAVQSIVGAAGTDYLFAITSTAIEPGDILDVRIVTVLTADAAERGDYDIDVVRLTTLGV